MKNKITQKRNRISIFTLMFKTT